VAAGAGRIDRSVQVLLAQDGDIIRSTRRARASPTSAHRARADRRRASARSTTKSCAIGATSAGDGIIVAVVAISRDTGRWSASRSWCPRLRGRRRPDALR
jgi:hypothetical protein